MKKKVLKFVKKKKFGNKLFFLKKRKSRKFIKIIRSKFRKIARKFKFRVKYFIKLKNVQKLKYTPVARFFNTFKYLILKKEFFLVKKLFFNLDSKNKYNYTISPIFNFERQFLFKFIEYNNLITESNVQPIFFKNSYKFYKNSGVNYLIKSDIILNNVDPKDPVFFEKFDLLNIYNDLNLFGLNLNKNIFFFLLSDFYKILIFLNFSKLINF